MRRVDLEAGPERAATLAARLEQAAAALVSVIQHVETDLWQHIPAPGEWSIGKDVEHVIEAAGYHQWIVRLTIREKVSSRRPVLERKRLTTDLSPEEAVALLRRRTEEGAELVRGLSDEHLNLPTRPPRARSRALAETIELVLIGHFDAHRVDVEAKKAAHQATPTRHRDSGRST
jgi:hypothetical protein